MSDDERKALNPGDLVTYLDDFSRRCETTVRLAPWQLAHGEWVIGLHNISGGYLLSRVIELVSAAEPSRERQIQMAAEKIVSRWERIEADGMMTGQQEQDADAGTDAMIFEVAKIIREYLGGE